jgi:hypothetical protein
MRVGILAIIAPQFFTHICTPPAQQNTGNTKSILLRATPTHRNILKG